MSEDNSSAKPDRFGKLLETLNQSELAMDSYELADMCWLLLNSPQVEEFQENDSEQTFTQISNPENVNLSNVDSLKQTPINLVILDRTITKKILKGIKNQKEACIPLKFKEKLWERFLHSLWIALLI